MYELEFHCPTAREQELCPWYFELWRQMPSSLFELDLYLKCHLEALLEGVEMPQDRDEVHIKQTEDERVENPAENSPAPSHPTTVAHSPDPIAATRPAPTARNVQRQLHSEDVQEKKSASTLYIDIQMHSFHPSPLLQRMTSKSYLHQLHINSINLAFFDLPDGLPPLQGDTPSWNILRPDHISQAVDVASKVLRYEGIMLVILPHSLFWGGLLATMAENDDSRLVEFTSGCLLSNIPVETKGAGGQIQKVLAWNYHALCHYSCRHSIT
ncbi:hypothetical protein SELMODRAFT_425114 [Selaginella moellendorffii]|uniref:Uncharacterized protein n=1 Tax=Selaginella moellendorffii TaxID=88036 RepID=D8SS21_SELML|nr:hypothetical protein SELMODRAFT_425114 [Selaginella moellendorffii]